MWNHWMEELSIFKKVIKFEVLGAIIYRKVIFVSSNKYEFWLF